MIRGFFSSLPPYWSDSLSGWVRWEQLLVVTCHMSLCMFFQLQASQISRYCNFKPMQDIEATCPRHVSSLQNNETHTSIPVELLEEILRCRWLSPIFIQERIAFITSVALVSKTWLEALLRITSRDVYIPCLAHYRQFTVGRSPFFRKFLPDVSPSQLCRTVTQQIPLSNKITKHLRFIVSRRKSTQNMLSTFHRLSLMPNLQTLTVEYYIGNHSFPFCASVGQLHLEYTFGSDCPLWLIDALLASRPHSSKHSPWALPRLEHISTPINEDPTTSIVQVLESCPHLQLAEERFTIQVHILSSSRRVPQNCTIFHGVIPSFRASVTNYPKIVKGSASVLIVIKDDDVVCEPSIDLTDMYRNVHVFVSKMDNASCPSILNDDHSRQERPLVLPTSANLGGRDATQ